MSTRPVISGLQAVRILAAVLVLLAHSGFYVSEHMVPQFSYWKQGAAGVDLFFVLSGFIMIYSSAHLFDAPDGWKTFSKNRITRIVPIYWLATSAKLAAMIAGAHYVLHAHLDPYKAIGSYLFLPVKNIDGEFRPVLGVGWTLNLEMFFYALFALALYLRVNVYRMIGPILALLTAASFFRVPAPLSFYCNPIVFDFFLGMLIARMSFKERAIPAKLSIASLAIGIYLLLFFHWPHGNFRFEGIAAALVIWATVESQPFFTGIPRWILYLGDISYALYLFHPMIAPAAPVLLMRLGLHSPLLSICISVILSIGGSCLIYSFIERPMTRFFKNARRRPMLEAIPEAN